MKKATLLGVLLLALVCGISFAQGPGRQRFRSERENRTRQDNSAEWAKAQAELKKKYPEKFKEIEKLQATNLFAALEKMRELASEASVTLPSDRRGPRGGWRGGMSGEGGDRRGGMGMRGGMSGGMFGNMRSPRTSIEAELKEKYPAEYAEVEKQRILAENKLEELAKKANVKLPATTESVRLKMVELKNSGKFKTEFEEIEKLRADDPRAAFQKTRELMQKAGIEMPQMGRFATGGFGRPGNSEMEAISRTPRENPMRRLMDLRKKYPEEMRRLDAARRDNPEAYRKGVMELLKKSEAEQGAPKPKT